jgi:hypothetical protein
MGKPTIFELFSGYRSDSNEKGGLKMKKAGENSPA